MSYLYSINIGLVPSTRFEDAHTIKPNVVIETLERNGFAVLFHRVHESHTEPTFCGHVLTLKHGESLDAAFLAVSNELKQDCISVLYGTGEGALIGSHAEEWGSFDPSYFLDPASGKYIAKNDDYGDYGDYVVPELGDVDNP